MTIPVLSLSRAMARNAAAILITPEIADTYLPQTRIILARAASNSRSWQPLSFDDRVSSGCSHSEVIIGATSVRARIRCGERRRQSSTSERTICRPFSCCSGTRESTVRYLGIEVDDALEISEQIESDIGGAARRQRSKRQCCLRKRCREGHIGQQRSVAVTLHLVDMEVCRSVEATVILCRVSPLI